MTHWDIAEPRASALIESLRAFGYTPETAVADLVDNSISAKSTTINIHFHWNGRDSLVTVLDNGVGMGEAEMLNAMRLGSLSPLQDRKPNDLGRFGLGLKTASFSQARELTVHARSAEGKEPTTRRWDLDTVEQTNQWRLLRDAPSTAPTPALATPTGTCVIWSKCDRLVGDVDPDDSKAHDRFNATIDSVSKHLSVVFHRFLSGPGKVTIAVNGRDIVPWDPFVESHPATQCLGTEALAFRGDKVQVTPFVLPHRDKLTDDEKVTGGGPDGWNQAQGFYLYRGGRLLVRGSWLNLGFAKDEHTKLARIRIDVPTTMDHHWQVDVKKASARAPGPLQPDLKRIAKSARKRAEDVYRFRGKATSRKRAAAHVHSWTQVNLRGATKYRINRSHPMIQALLTGSSTDRIAVEKVLRLIEETLPIPLIGLALAKSIDEPQPPFAQSSSEVAHMFRVMVEQAIGRGDSPRDAIDRFAKAEPFVDHPEVVQAISEEIL